MTACQMSTPDACNRVNSFGFQLFLIDVCLYLACIKGQGKCPGVAEGLEMEGHWAMSFDRKDVGRCVQGAGTVSCIAIEAL